MDIKNILGLVMTFALLFSSAASNANAQSDTSSGKVNIEAFTISTLSDTKNAEGFYVPTGHKDVNSMMEIIEKGDEITTKQSMIEDFFDTNGNYLSTVARQEEFTNNWLNGNAAETRQSK
jgi:hypothetical protein